MGSKERRERERAEIRDRILDAARELFARDGVEAVTMRAVADRIDYTPTAIYYHFADKEQLILELCHADFRALAQAMNSGLQAPDPIERLKELGMGYAEFGLTHPSHYQFMFMTPRLPHDPSGMMMGNPEEDAYEVLIQTVTRAIESGRLRPELTDVHQVAQMVWAAVHGVVSLHLAKGEDPWVKWGDARESVRVMIDSITRGILRAPSN